MALSHFCQTRLISERLLSSFVLSRQWVAVPSKAPMGGIEAACLAYCPYLLMEKEFSGVTERRSSLSLSIYMSHQKLHSSP